jgi:hypothetical protein
VTEKERLEINSTMRTRLNVNDSVVNMSDIGACYGLVGSVGRRVMVRWQTRVPSIEGHRTKEAYYEPFQFTVTVKASPKWRLWPRDKAEENFDKSRTA